MVGWVRRRWRKVSGKTGWQKIARRVRVPLGFVVAAIFLVFAAAELAYAGVEPAAGSAGIVAARLCGWLCKEECGAYAYRAVCVYAESAVSRVDGDCGWVCGGGWTLVAGGVAGGDVSGDLCADNSVGGERFCGARLRRFEEYARKVPRLLPRVTAARFGDAERAVGQVLRGALPASSRVQCHLWAQSRSMRPWRCEW